MTGARVASVHYRVEAADLHAHLVRVTLQVAEPSAHQQVSLPVWIPGSYLVREFSKNLLRIAAKQDGRAVVLHQLDKCTWQFDCLPGSPLVITYDVYAFDNYAAGAYEAAVFHNYGSRLTGLEDAAYAYSA